MPKPVVPARHARSTVLIGSIASIREAGRFDEYAARLPPAYRDVLFNLVAGAWVPIDIALSHYEACETLGFPADQQVANGRSTFDRTSGTLLGTAIRMAKEGGVTPWTVFPYYQRFWERGYDGGGIGIVKTGPKEARVDLVAFRLADSRYYRNALRGLLTGVTELFCQKVYVTERPGMRHPASVMFRVQWA
jgi:hypothetical protein